MEHGPESKLEEKKRSKEKMSAMLSSDATFSMEMFPFGQCPEGNGDVSSVCPVCENNNNNNNNKEENERRWRRRA
ncbi:hypothetical protein Tco_0986232 [Tanacetum coccineum]